MKPDADGKIRVRCANCNKRLKFPAEKAGTVYNCPVCGATVVSPLDGVSPKPVRDATAPVRKPPATPIAKESPTPPKPPAAAAESSKAWTPTRMLVEPNQAIGKLCNFLARQNADVGKAAHEVIVAEAADVSATDLMGGFARLRAERGRRLQEFVEKLRDDVGARIRQLEKHPMGAQGNIGRELWVARKERRDLEAFISVFLMGKTSPEE